MATWFERRRGTLAVLTIAATAAALIGVARLQYDDVPRTTFRSHDADFARLEQVFRDFGADDVGCVLLVEADDLFTPANVAALGRLIAEVRALPGVANVQSLADVRTFPTRYVPRIFTPLSRAIPTQPYSLLPAVDPDGGLPSSAACRAARAAATTHPLAAGQLVSDDGRATLVVADLAGENPAIKDLAPVVEAMRRLGEKHAAASGLTVRLTGLAPIRVEIFESVRRESERFVLVGGTLALLMAAVMFRRPAAVAIVCLASLLGAAWTVGLMGLAGEKMNIITTVLPTLVLVIGFTDAVHLMIDVRQARARGVPPSAAARDALRHLGLPCLLCAATTAVGFGSLAVARIEIIQQFGIVCGVGAVLALAAVLVVVPLLSSTRWGLRVHSSASLDLPQRIARRWEPAFRRLLDRPRTTTACGCAATAAMAASFFLLVPSNQATEALPTHSPAFAAVQELDRNFGGSDGAQILVEWDAPWEVTSPEVLAAIDEAQRFAAGRGDVRRPSSVVNLIRSLPGRGETLARQAAWLKWVPEETLRHYVRTDLRRALVRLRLADVGSDVRNATFDELRGGLARIEAAHPGVRFHLTGTSVLAARNLNQMIGDLAASLGSAAAVIFVVMAAGFRSLRLGLVSIVPNLFPMVVTATYLVVTGRPLQMTSVIVFSICLGIAVDDTIHFINRFQREMAADGDVRSAILRSYRAVGAAMIMTSAVLLAGFGSLQISEMPTTRLFSGLSCLTICAALIGDLVILPAMLRTFVPDRIVREPHFAKLARREPAAVE